MKLKAFTLAEVLITLMIIGIVAALTIPSVISNYQQQEFKTGLKKAVSVLNEAIQMNITQEGETPYENEDLFNYLKKHMSVISGEGNIETLTCFDSDGSGKVFGEESNYCYGGNSNNGYQIKNKIFYTTDGMRYEIPYNVYENSYNPSKQNSHLVLHETGYNLLGNKKSSYDGPSFQKCGSYGLSSNPNKTLEAPCFITVDVNGDKKPNSMSKTQPGHAGQVYTIPYSFSSPTDKKLQDIFTILITDEKAIPFGVVAQRAMYSK